MRRVSVARGALTGAAGGVGAALLFLLGQVAAGLPNGAYLGFEWLARVLPGRLLSGGIDVLIALVRAAGVGPTARVAKTAEKGFALALLVLACAVLSAIVAAAARRRPKRLPGFGLAAGVALGAAVTAMGVALGQVGGPAGFLWLAAVCVGWGALVGHALLPRTSTDVPAASRRASFTALATSAAAALVALGLGRWRRRVSPRPGATSTAITPAATSGPAASPSEQALAARFAPVPGTRPEVTANADFYRVDINLSPPTVDTATWRLEVGGLVERPLVLTVDELRARPSVTQAITLECISNPVGGDLISTSLWTGLPLRDLLREVGVRGGARALHIEAEDGFHETVELGDARDPRTLLVYAMNGEPLPAEHGFPLRIYIPDRYGMKQPKWIRRLALVDRPRPGYWVERGWSQEAKVQTTAVVDTVTNAPGGALAVGGIAFAGARGVSRVEVQLDDGPWSPAELRAPPLGPLTWIAWRATFTAPPGRHTVRARAYDARGTLQPVDARPPHPAGATGVHAVTRRTG